MNMSRLYSGKDPSEMLEQVRRIEAPPFLFTRIRQKIADAEQRIATPWVLATGISMLLLLFLNFCVISKNTTGSRLKESAQLAQSMQLMPENSLYE